MHINYVFILTYVRGKSQTCTFTQMIVCVDLKLILEKCGESNSAFVYGNRIVTDKRGCSGIKQFGLNMWI